eukprot:13608543-Alexandrium_andersonii.AAC.1
MPDLMPASCPQCAAMPEPMWEVASVRPLACQMPRAKMTAFSVRTLRVPREPCLYPGALALRVRGGQGRPGIYGCMLRPVALLSLLLHVQLLLGFH